MKKQKEAEIDLLGSGSRGYERVMLGSYLKTPGLRPAMFTKHMKMVLVLLSVVFILLSGQANASDENEGFVLKESSRWVEFGNYQVNIDKWGIIGQIDVDGVTLITGYGLFSAGEYKSQTTGKDNRLWQGRQEKGGVEPAKVIDKDGNLILKRAGVFGNEEYPEMISYQEEITATPAGAITFHYKTEYLETLTWNGVSPIRTLTYISMEAVKGKGYRLDGIVGINPVEYSKELAFRCPIGVKEAQFATSGGSLVIKAEDRTIIAGYDTRSESTSGGIRVDLCPDDPWKNGSETTITKGTKKEINYTIQLPVKGAGKLQL